MSHVLSAKKYNEMQNIAYNEYCEKCRLNGMTPAKQEMYFARCPVNYGFVQFNSTGNNISWKKRKKDFLK